MRKDKTASFVSKRFALTTCSVHEGKGKRSKTLCLYVTARDSAGEKASGTLCKEHAAAFDALATVPHSLF